MMLDHAPLKFGRNEYYAPVPMMIVDQSARITDFNIAAELLLSPHLQAARQQPVVQFLQSWEGDASGDLLPIGAEDFDGERGWHDKNELASRHEFVSQLQTECFGRVELSGTAITNLEPEKGSLASVTVYWNPRRIEKETSFRKQLTEECDHQQTWDSYAISYDRLMPQLDFYKTACQRHVSAMNHVDVDSVLDLGAGTGNVAIPLAEMGHHVTALDLSRAMLQRLIDKTKKAPDIAKRIEAVEQSAESLLQWKGPTFDGVTVLLALFDMRDPEHCLDEALRVLRPGGRLVITEPRRCFQMQPLIDFTERYLKENGLEEKFQDDWKRVCFANKSFKVAKGTVNFPAEAIEQKLAARGVQVTETQESHFGNCATIWATKPLDAPISPTPSD